MESWLLAQQALIASINAEIEAMKICNKQRELRGESIAYPESNFMDKARQLEGIYLDIMQKR